jgi:hypothetical protein
MSNVFVRLVCSTHSLQITHVDTSTGVRSDAKHIAQVIKKASPDTLIIREWTSSFATRDVEHPTVDAVCSVASEEIKMEEWGIDVVLTATQKGLGTPPGLSVLCASPRAIEVSETCSHCEISNFCAPFRFSSRARPSRRRTTQVGRSGCQSCRTTRRVLQHTLLLLQVHTFALHSLAKMLTACQ